MYKKVLVPLDGSRDAEQVLPVAVRLAQTGGCAIILLHAVPTIYGYGPYHLQPPFEGQTVFTEKARQAKDYLEQQARSHDLAGRSVTTEIMIGAAAESIHAYAQRHEVDLILLHRHGYTGLKRWAMGNVTHKITRSSNIPVLVLQKERAFLATLSEQQHSICALVGLDGSSLAEAALLPTAYLISLLKTSGSGKLHLTTILESSVTPEKAAHPLPEEPPTSIKTVRDEEPEIYLKSVARRLETALAPQLHLQVSWSVHRHVDSAQALLEIAAQGNDNHRPYDLIALATHGRGAFQRWILGSIADRILTSAPIPVLLVRPKEVHLPEHDPLFSQS